MFFWAVRDLPLADAITFYLAGPIYVTVFSALLLKEKVDWRRWTAVLVGFAGVVIALRPSAASFTLPALIALTGSVFFALLMVVTRILRDTSDTVLMTGQFFGSFAFGAATAPFVWITPTPYDFFFLSAFGAVSIAALFCINRSLKLAPASVVVPYQYTMLIWAIALGYLVFGDVPDAPMLAGAAIIVASGLYIFWREQRTQREAVAAPVP
jgi:drug/metabolite transporter (DMT)-like permease